MRLSDESYEEIKQEVIHLFKEYNIRCTPICGFEIATKMGIVLISYSSLSQDKRAKCFEISEDGFLFVSNFKEYIYYNDYKSYGRINMTILHEIGHLVLGHNDDMKQEESESEAAFFAKYAAAPPPLVHKYNPTSYRDIMEHFDVTEEASKNAWRYYQNWLKHGGEYYTLYEEKLLLLFEDDSSHDTTQFYMSNIFS